MSSEQSETPRVVARLNVALIPPGLQALKELQALFDDPTYNDIVNRALVLHAFVEQQLRAGNTFYVRKTEDNEIYELDIILSRPSEEGSKEG